MRRILITLALVGSLGGCANVQTAWDVLTTSQVTPQVVIVAGNTFDALQATATGYLRLPKCTPSNRPVCRDPLVTPKLIAAVRAGRVARNNLEQFFNDHPGQLGPQGLYDAFKAAIDTLQTIVVQNNIGAGK